MDIDYDVSTFIIDKDNNYIDLQEYDKYDDEGVFVCITNDYLNSETRENNSICIYKDWRNELIKAIPNKAKYIDFDKDDRRIKTAWQYDAKTKISHNDIFIANKMYANSDDRENYLLNYIDGFLSCQDIISNFSTSLTHLPIERFFPAIMLTYNTKVHFDNRWYRGYLPAIGQLMYISENIDKINSALLMMDSECFDVHVSGKLKGGWWSSTEKIYYSSYFLLNGNTMTESKVKINISVLALFYLF